MKTIGDLLARNLTQKIEEIIKVDQTNEKSVHSEITEYVATDRIKDQYREILRSIADAPKQPHEGIGVWISGFFGSGKSSFAKNLGYVLANRDVLGESASELFKNQVDDRRIGEWIDFINTSIPSEVIMFDVSVDTRSVKRATEQISEIIYTVLLRELGYAEDHDIAELEIELEAEGELDDFVARCEAKYGNWNKVRKGAKKISRASAILHEMDADTFPSQDSWAQSLRDKSSDITVRKVVNRTFELAKRRCPGKAVVFIIDEVGQYVAHSSSKIEDLRALMEEFGRVGNNLVQAGEMISPVWIVVTSQEKLEEVVAAIDSKRVRLATMQDRFKYRIDLAPADIREVATRRVLRKKDEAIPVLRQLYDTSQGQLNAALRLERTARNTEITEGGFIQFYPYPPHFVEMSIDIMSGIRLQPGAPRHLGGSNRTIIKQTYEMLVSERTNMAAQPFGTLVTMDRIFELVEGNLATEKQKDISDIRQRFEHDPEDGGWALRVAKAVCLLEFVRDLPRTEANIAACLVDEVGQPPPIDAVREAVERLQNAQFIRNTENGWKLQTAQEKNWETERRGFLSPKPRDRNEILRESLKAIFGDPKLKTYNFKGLRHFRVGINVDGSSVGDEGQILISIRTAEDGEMFPEQLAKARDDSRRPDHQNDVYWVYALTPEVDDLVANVHASRKMVSKYDQMRAQNRINSEESACLQDEKTEVLRLHGRLREKLSEALRSGTGLFRGISRSGSDLGKSLGDIYKGLFDLAVPDLYPKLEMAARPLKGTEAEEILKAATLPGLPQVFYGGEGGLGLVVKDGTKYICNPGADVAKEVLDYLNGQHAWGNKETRTGKSLELHFGGLGYGWERDVLRLILAVLFRAGSIEVSHGGRRFDSYQEPASRVPFTNNVAFRSALFTPVEEIGLPQLKQAVEQYEELTGSTVGMDKNAIATAIKKVAGEELGRLAPIEAQAAAYHLPVGKVIADFRETLSQVQTGAANTCVKVLAGEGTSLREARDRVYRIRDAMSTQCLATLRQARRAEESMWPMLKSRGENGDLASEAGKLRELLASETFYDAIPVIETSTKAIASAYRALYQDLHTRRAERFEAALETVKGHPEWPTIAEEMRAPLLSALASRACQELDLPEDQTVCGHCKATVAQMDSDLAAFAGLKAEVLARIQELTAGKQEVERVRLSDFFAASLDSEESVEQAIEQLRGHLLKLLAEKVKIIVE